MSFDVANSMARVLTIDAKYADANAYPNLRVVFYGNGNDGVGLAKGENVTLAGLLYRNAKDPEDPKILNITPYGTAAGRVNCFSSVKFASGDRGSDYVGYGSYSGGGCNVDITKAFLASEDKKFTFFVKDFYNAGGGRPYAGKISISYGSPLTCTGFTYTPWEACVNKTQQRLVLSASPMFCTGGTPVLQRACTGTSTCVEGDDVEYDKFKKGYVTSSVAAHWADVYFWGPGLKTSDVCEGDLFGLFREKLNKQLIAQGVLPAGTQVTEDEIRFWAGRYWGGIAELSCSFKQRDELSRFGTSYMSDEQCPNGCKDGACLPPDPSLSCHVIAERSATSVQRVEGTVKGVAKTESDRCFVDKSNGSSYVLQVGCSGGSSEIMISPQWCGDFGCLDGKCLTDTTPPTTSVQVVASSNGLTLILDPSENVTWDLSKFSAQAGNVTWPADTSVIDAYPGIVWETAYYGPYSASEVQVHFAAGFALDMYGNPSAAQDLILPIPAH